MFYFKQCDMSYVETVGGNKVKTVVVNATFGTDVELRLSKNQDTGNRTALCRYTITQNFVVIQC